MNNNVKCTHKHAYVKSTMDTTIACYLIWRCDCGVEGTIKITREMYNNVNVRMNE